MKIVGIEGLDTQTIRDEVARGARFVFYQYCVSIVVMTFKRPSSVYFLKPGQNRTFKGLPFTLLSLLAGWWGFPWGPVYTLQTVVDNLLGGKDVTEAVLASLAPPTPAAAAAAPAVPSPGLQQAPPPSLGKKIAVGAAVVLVLAGTIIGSICYYRRTHLTVALVAGTEKPYTVQLNGTRYQLTPGQPVVLTMAEGRLALTGGPPGSSPQTFEFSLPFFDHLSQSRVAVINPDRTAIIYEERTTYHPKGTKPDPNEHRSYTVYANEASYFLPAPDHVFTDFPETIQMPEGQTATIRSRLAQFVETSPEEGADLLASRRDYATMQRHLELLGRWRSDDEELLTTAAAKLKPDDARAFFESRLTDHPVRVQWHRFYQDLMERHFPDHDLAAQYDRLAAAEPEDGAWCYLRGRISLDIAQARDLYERALTAPKPCVYAYFGLGYQALSRADFARALECFDQAETKGLAPMMLQYNRRQARLGAHDYARLRQDAVAARKAAPASLAAAAEEITCDLLDGPDIAAAEKVKAESLAQVDRAEPSNPKARAMADAFLSSVIAYLTNDVPGFAREAAKLEIPAFAFQAAISQGDAAAAVAALKKTPGADGIDYLLCYLVAAHRHDEAAATANFSQALETLAQEDRDNRRLALLLSRSDPPTVDEVNAIPLYPQQKRIVMAALGWRHPDRRADFFLWARRMNFDPAFPRLLIEKVTTDAAAPGI